MPEGTAKRCGRRQRRWESENVTGKGGRVLSREKQNAETGRLAPWCLRMNEADGKRVQKKKKKKKETARGEKKGGAGTQVPARRANITPAMLARASRDVLQPRRRTCAGFIGRGVENLCGDSRWQVVLYSRDEKPKFLPSPPHSPLAVPSSLPRPVPLLLNLSFSLRDWDPGGWQETSEHVLLKAINI